MSQKIAVVCQDRKRTEEIVTGLMREIDSPLEYLYWRANDIRVTFRNGGEIVWVNCVNKARGRWFTGCVVDPCGCRSDFHEIVEEVQYRVRPEYGGSEV